MKMLEKCSNSLFGKKASSQNIHCWLKQELTIILLGKPIISRQSSSGRNIINTNYTSRQFLKEMFAIPSSHRKKTCPNKFLLD